MTDPTDAPGPAEPRATEPRADTPCPICGKPGRTTFWPFCSQRCADVDLGRWLGGRYAIPGPEASDDDGPA